MKLKKLLILSGVVLTLVLFVYIKNVVYKIQRTSSQKEDKAIFLIPDAQNIFANQIVVYKGDDQENKVTLVKQINGDWIVENKFGLKARKPAVDGILNSLKDLKGEVRGESKGVFSDFQIRDQEGVHLILKSPQGKPLTHLVVSFKRPNFSQNFVRLADSEDVLLVDRNILSGLGLFDKTAKLNASFFSDYKVFSFDPNSVVKIELRPAKKGSLVLSKGDLLNPDSPWEFEPKGPKAKPDSVKINEFLKNVLEFHALDSLDPKGEDYGWDKPFMELKLGVLKDKKTEEIQMTIGSFIKDKNAYYVRVLPETRVFIIADYSINNINRDKAYFLNKPDKSKKKK